jgi:hypothetical protein
MSRSPTAAMMENCIYRKTHRKKRKPELNPSDIPTFNYTAHLADVVWLRVRARKRA